MNWRGTIGSEKSHWRKEEKVVSGMDRRKLDWVGLIGEYYIWLTDFVSLCVGEGGR